MKVCPVCSESFDDQLTFCDLDGARLQREGGVTGALDPSRVWPVLGVGLLVGAVVISTASIVFFPRAPVPSLEAPQPPAFAPPPSSPVVALTPETPLVEDGPIYDPPVVALDSEAKKKDKAAAAVEEELSRQGENGEAAPAPPTRSEEASSTPPKRAAEVASEESPRPSREAAADGSPAEAKKESAKAPDKASAKDAAKKKDDGKEKKKKGGFRSVFKKIFGKGDSDK